MIQQQLTQENYQQVFADFMSRYDASLHDFVKQVNTEAQQTVLDYSPESLDVAWFYVRDRVQREPRIEDFENSGRVPLWLTYMHDWAHNLDELEYTQASYDLIEKLTYYYAEVCLRHVPNAQLMPDLDIHLTNFVYYPIVTNYKTGEEREEGYRNPPYIYIQGLLYGFLETKEEASLKFNYDNFLNRMHKFQAKPDSEKYPPPFILEVHGRKLKRDWDGHCDIAVTGGYYEVEVTKDAERQLGSVLFNALDKHFESIDGVAEVFWYGRDSMQIATTYKKKELEKALLKKYQSLKEQAEADT